MLMGDKNMNIIETIFHVLGIIFALLIILLMTFLLISWAIDDLPFFKATKRREKTLDDREKSSTIEKKNLTKEKIM